MSSTCFLPTPRRAQTSPIAKADARKGGGENNKVKQIQEIFCDVIATDECTFVIDSKDCFKDDSMRALIQMAGCGRESGNNVVFKDPTTNIL